jgi:DNA invertase Pin-like site-specific DNA recombinase
VRWLHARFSSEKSRNVADGIARSPKRAGRPRAHVPEDEVLRMAAKGMSLRAISRRTGVSTSVLQRFLAAHKARQSAQETPSSGCRE